MLSTKPQVSVARLSRQRQDAREHRQSGGPADGAPVERGGLLRRGGVGSAEQAPAPERKDATLDGTAQLDRHAPSPARPAHSPSSAISGARHVGAGHRAPAAGTTSATSGTPGTKSLNLVASALEATPGGLYVGGLFTDAGGHPNADRIARWDGSAWSAYRRRPARQRPGVRHRLSGGKVYIGGTFTNAGGNPDADFLAAWNGSAWVPLCARRADPRSLPTSAPCRSSATPSTSAGPSRMVPESCRPTRLVGCDLDAGLAAPRSTRRTSSTAV